MRCSGVQVFQEFLCRKASYERPALEGLVGQCHVGGKATGLVGLGHLEACPGLAAPQLCDPNNSFLQQSIPPQVPLLLKEEVGLAHWFHKCSEGRKQEHSMNLTEQMAYSGQRGSAQGRGLQPGQEGQAVLGKAEGTAQAVAWKQEGTESVRLDLQGHNSSVP